MISRREVCTCISISIILYIRTLYITLGSKHQDTRLCVVQPSSGARDTVCYLHKPTFSCFQPFIAQKLLNQNYVLDALIKFERNQPSGSRDTRF